MLRPSLLKVIAEKHDIGKKHFLFSGHFDRYQRNYYLQIGSYRNQLALTKVSKEQKHGRNKARIIQVVFFLITLIKTILNKTTMQTLS